MSEPDDKEPRYSYFIAFAYAFLFLTFWASVVIVLVSEKLACTIMVVALAIVGVAWLVYGRKRS